MSDSKQEQGEEAEACQGIEEKLLARLGRVAAATDGGEGAEVKRHLPGGNGAGSVHVCPGFNAKEVLDKGPRHLGKKIKNGRDVFVVGQGVDGEALDDDDAGEHGDEGGEGFVEAEASPARDEEAGEGKDGGLAGDGEGEHEEGSEEDVAAAQEEQKEAKKGAVQDVGENERVELLGPEEQAEEGGEEEARGG